MEKATDKGNTISKGKEIGKNLVLLGNSKFFKIAGIKEMVTRDEAKARSLRGLYFPLKKSLIIYHVYHQRVKYTIKYSFQKEQFISCVQRNRKGDVWRLVSGPRK